MIAKTLWDALIARMGIEAGPVKPKRDVRGEFLARTNRSPHGELKARAVKVREHRSGLLTVRATDATIGKRFGNLRHMRWKPGQPRTPQELRRRALRKAFARTGRVDPAALERDAELEAIEAKTNRKQT